MLLAKKNFIAANAVQNEIHNEFCDRQWDLAMTLRYPSRRTMQVRGKPARVAAQAAQPIYLGFVRRYFLPVRSAVSQCRSAHFNPTVVAVPRRMGFVLV
jgi:hypothetical protein